MRTMFPQSNTVALMKSNIANQTQCRAFLHARSLIDAEKKIVHIAKGDMEVLLVIYQVSEEPKGLVFW